MANPSHMALIDTFVGCLNRDTRTQWTKETELPPHPCRYFLQIMVKAPGQGNVDKYAMLLPMLLEMLVSRAFRLELFTSTRCAQTNLV